MIGISADFDPVHKGHEQLIKKAKQIADEKGKTVVVYLNKEYSANHAPFFVNFEARSRMALECGADKIIPVEGLHHRFVLSYSVPIRLAKMHDDGVTDYITAASISLNEIQKKAEKFIKQEKFVGMPKNYPNRNEIRWYALNEFLAKKYGKKLNFHIIKELKDNGKISGRLIRQSILDNDLIIPKEIKKVLPKSTVKILKEEIEKCNIPGRRNYKEIYKRMNTYSRGKLEKIAYLNGNTINEIIKKRVYRDPESIWAAFRRSGYGPVMTRLAISAIEKEVTKEEVMDLMIDYENKGVIPPEQSINRVIERAWYVASQSEKGIPASEANEKFRNEKIAMDNVPLTINAGLSLTKFESEIVKEGLNCELFIDKNNKISVEMRTEGKKIKTNLRLPAKEVTYLRYIMDSNFIPTWGRIEKYEKGFKVRINIKSIK